MGGICSLTDLMRMGHRAAIFSMICARQAVSLRETSMIAPDPYSAKYYTETGEKRLIYAQPISMACSLHPFDFKSF